ncbi:helix-turn-helix domain-containing protein [Spirillospora sp. CA-128828]|uniref:helix-turn-helix domain-containing protein n=1 Tax=Spirillospora sp. CA-128828 TaxID=3240033 RepID=UPI003D8A1EC9
MRIEEIVGGRLRERREAEGLTQEEFGAELAKYLGKPWPRQAVSTAEKGHRSFTAAELMACSMALRIGVADLFKPPFGAFELTFPSGLTIAYDPSAHPDESPEIGEVRRSLTSFIEHARESQRVTGEALAFAKWLYDDLNKATASRSASRASREE